MHLDSIHCSRLDEKGVIRVNFSRSTPNGNRDWQSSGNIMKLLGRVSGLFARFFNACRGVLKVNFIITGRLNQSGLVRFRPTTPRIIQSQASNIHSGTSRSHFSGELLGGTEHTLVLLSMGLGKQSKTVVQSTGRKLWDCVSG